MVEAGKLEIKGTLDNSDIKRGTREINSGLQVVKQKTQSTTGSLAGLASTAGGLATSFVAVGAAGIGALTALAGQSPQVADEMARLQIESFKLTNTMGTIFEPVFQNLVEGFSDFNQVISENQDTISEWVDFGLVVAKGALKDVGGLLDNVKEKYNELDRTVSEKTGGVSFSEEFKTQFEDVKTSIEERGLKETIFTEAGQTADALLNLAFNFGASIGQSVLGGDQAIISTNFFESLTRYNYYDQSNRTETYFNVDTVGD